MRRGFALFLALTACVTATRASAEQLLVTLSNQHIAINSNFIGENLVLFGTIEADSGKTLRSGGYDLVVTVSGPSVNLRTRRKARVLGIWMNVELREFVGVPAYLAVLSNRPVAAIADARTLRQQQIGLDNISLPQRSDWTVADDTRGDQFRQAFVRQQMRHDFYFESPNAVVYLTPGVFRTSISLPANIPTGNYAVDVKLLAGGVLAAQTETSFQVIKEGFEQYVAEAARDDGLLYGFSTALMALLTGWVASAVFRRD